MTKTSKTPIQPMVVSGTSIRNHHGMPVIKSRGSTEWRSNIRVARRTTRLNRRPSTVINPPTAKRPLPTSMSTPGWLNTSIINLLYIQPPLCVAYCHRAWAHCISFIWGRRPPRPHVTIVTNAGDTMKLICALSLLLAPGLVSAHSGGTDAQGCHTNRKAGDYHCHGAKGSNAAALPRKSAPAQSADPTCHVGPRGGTYTITKSGRKNYAGC